MAVHTTPNLHEITIFIAVAESASFSQAARRLHLSQPAVSQTIHNLEREFGTRLFERDGHAILLTPAGQALLPVARNLACASRQVVDRMNRVETLVIGELLVGCSATAGKYVLPGLVGSFHRQYPEVRVHLELGSKEAVFTRLLDGQLTLGVMTSLSEQPGLEYYPFYEDRVILVVPTHHPWATFGRALPADLTDQPLIMPEANSSTSTLLLEALAQHRLSANMLDVVIQVSNAEATEIAVEEGLGIAFISELAAERGLALGRIKRVEVDGLDLRRTVYLVRNLDWALTRAHELFWTYVAEHPIQRAAPCCPLVNPEPATSAPSGE